MGISAGHPRNYCFSVFAMNDFPNVIHEDPAKPGFPKQKGDALAGSAITELTSGPEHVNLTLEDGHKARYVLDEGASAPYWKLFGKS